MPRAFPPTGCWKNREVVLTRIFYSLDILNFFIISSPELKAQISFSDHLSSRVCLSVRLSVKISHFHLLLQNNWANFNQNLHTPSFGEGDSSFLKWRAMSLPSGDNNEIAKIHWQTLNIFFSRNTGPISTKLGTKQPWVKGIQFFFSNEGPRSDDSEIAKMHWRNLKIFFSRTTRPIA